MKKTLLFVICIAAFTLQGISQVTITESDIANIGATFSQRTDTLPSITPGTTGTGQVWNFNSLASHVTKTINAVDPLTLPAGNRFTGANIALHEDSSINNYFFRKEPTGILTKGLTMDFLGNGDTICVIFNDPDTMISFPSIYGTSFISHVNGDTKSPSNMIIDTNIFGTLYHVPVDSVRIIHHAVKSSIMDAEGLINLPGTAGTMNALRQNTHETSIDSTFGYVNFAPYLLGWYFFQAYTDETTQFIWWTNDIGNAILSMDYDSLSGNVTNVNWLYITHSGIEQNAASNQTTVFPNPATDYISLTAQAGTEICIFNSVGQNVMRTTANGQLQKINVADLPRGLYFARFMDTDDLRSEKFLLQ